ncbi:MAG: hypothetical protein AB7V18_13560 [Pyrinomonadaceae bacterium]
MIVSLVLMLAVTAGGFSLTYLIERDEPFIWRVCAGSVIGSAVFGTLAFLFAMAAGLTSITVAAAMLMTAAPLVLFANGRYRSTFKHDWAKANGKLQGATLPKFLRFFYYFGFLLLFIFFFDRAMIESGQGIFTGGSNNLGDLPFHLGAIFSFAEGANFPPQNPNFAGSRFSYPFIADLITAAFLKFDVSVRDAMFVQNVSWAFSLLVILERFVRRLVRSDLAAKVAPALLFFSGGLGFALFASDYLGQTKGLFEFLNALPRDYSIGEDLRWGNSLITLFLTQRSLLLGMPIAIVILNFLWREFSSEDVEREVDGIRRYSAPVLFGLIAGLLPLVHLHSLAALFIVAACLLVMRLQIWDRLFAFAVGVCLTAIPELMWSIMGTANRPSEFFAWHFGFDARDTNILWFWIKNTGLVIPLLITGIVAAVTGRFDNPPKRGKGDGTDESSDRDHEHSRGRALALFYVPFALIFFIGNIAKLAPWEWDNIKVLIYWFLGSIPFIVISLMWMWRTSKAWRVAAAIAFILLIVSGAIDVWRTVSGQINYRVFDADAVIVARRIRASTEPDSLFLNAPTYNTAVVLTGRRSVMRYPGHLSSHGIDYREREDDVKTMYRGGPEAVDLFKRYGVKYVLISPEVKMTMGPNEAFFARYPVIAESGQYRVHRIVP